jgi:hypothetical protein
MKAITVQKILSGCKNIHMATLQLRLYELGGDVTEVSIRASKPGDIDSLVCLVKSATKGRKVTSK